MLEMEDNAAYYPTQMGVKPHAITHQQPVALLKTQQEEPIYEIWM